LDTLSEKHQETPLYLLSADENGMAQHYAQMLISWFQEVRGHLIEILGQTSVLLNEKEERKKRRREDRKCVYLMASLRTRAMKVKSRLDDVVRHQELKALSKDQKEPTPILPDAMEVDDDQLADHPDIVTAEVVSETSASGSDFIALVEDVCHG
jgi:hypothetical protein